MDLPLNLLMDPHQNHLMDLHQSLLMDHHQNLLMDHHLVLEDMEKVVPQEVIENGALLNSAWLRP